MTVSSTTTSQRSGAAPGYGKDVLSPIFERLTGERGLHPLRTAKGTNGCTSRVEEYSPYAQRCVRPFSWRFPAQMPRIIREAWAEGSPAGQKLCLRAQSPDAGKGEAAPKRTRQKQ